MMLVPHACLNAAVGRLLKKPATAFAVGVAGHVLLDLVPHKDVSAHKAEGLAVLIMLGLIASSCGWSSPAFWCAMGGVLPDVEQVLPWTDPKRGYRRWFPTHNPKFHSLPVPHKRDWRAPLITPSVVSMVALMIATGRCHSSRTSN